MVISDTVVFREKNTTRKKEGYYIIIKGLIHQEDITILNMHVPNNRTSKYMK